MTVEIKNTGNWTRRGGYGRRNPLYKSIAGASVGQSLENKPLVKISEAEVESFGNEKYWPRAEDPQYSSVSNSGRGNLNVNPLYRQH